MPIELKDYRDIKEKVVRTDKELLKFMQSMILYTTNDIQEFLEINHTATLQRLKKLVPGGYIKLYTNNRIYQWEKIKDMEDKEIYRGYGFYEN